jgi:hypothetical protein
MMTEPRLVSRVHLIKISGIVFHPPWSMTRGSRLCLLFSSNGIVFRLQSEMMYDEWATARDSFLEIPSRLSSSLGVHNQ